MTRHRFAAVALTILVTLPLVGLIVFDRDEVKETLAAAEADSAPPEEEGGQQLILQDENGVIPYDAHLKAMMQRQRLLDSSPLVAADAGVTRTTWTSLGPKFSGRIRTIVIHPTRTNHMLVGAATGGVFKSTDAGANWRPVDEFLPGMAIRTFALNPTNPEQVYAGTGEVVRGVGLLRSNDFGETWQHVAGTESMATVQRIRFTPNGTLYVAAEGGVYRTTDGTTFTRLHTGGADDIEIDPSNPSRLIVSAYFDRKKVIARFDGSSWTTSTGAPAEPGYFDFIELAYAPSNPQIVYALTSEPNQGKFYRSDDGGASFRFVSNSPGVTGASWASALWVNPFDSDSIVAGGVSMGKSADGGKSWSAAWWPGHCTPREVCVWGPVDHHEVVAHPAFDNATNRSLYVVADQGVFLLPDLRDDRLEARIGGLITMQFYGAAVDQGSGRILAGTQDMGTQLLIDDVTVSGGVAGGDGGFDAIDPRNPDLFYITVRSSTDRLGLIRILGVNSSSRTVAGLMRCDEPAYRLPDACERLGNPESPVVMDMRAPDRLYAGGLRLWRTDNATEAVSPTSGPRWTNLALPGERAQNFISAIAISPLDSNVVWAARNAGEIYVTSNGTAPAPTWVRVGESQLPPRFPTRIVIARQDPQMVYITFGGYAANVWRTFNNGVHWDNVTGGATVLPLVPVRDLEIHPAANGAHWLYVATEIGLFTSENAGHTWFVPSSGPAAVRIDELAWHNQNLILATHGRGLWKAAVGNPTPMTIPGPPINFSASVAAGTLSAAWDASPIGASPQQYLIQVSTSTNFSSPLAELPTGLARTFSFSGVPQGAFYLRVVARNAAGFSGPSNVQVIGVPAAQPPGAPSNLVANVNGNTLTLNWSTPTSGGAPTTYYIDAGTAAGSSNIASLPTGNTQTSFTVTAPNGLYYVRVRAGNSIGAGAASNEVTFRVGPEPCVIPPRNPTNLQASVIGGIVTLSWTPPTGPGLTGYRVEAGSAAGLSNIATIQIGVTTTFQASAPRGTYFVRMISLSVCGPSNPSPDVTVVVP